MLKQEKLDIEAVVAEWGDLVAQKKQAYADFYESIRYLKQCHGVLLAVHNRQEQATVRLPGPVRQRLGFPDAGTFMAHMIGPNPTLKP